VIIYFDKDIDDFTIFLIYRTQELLILIYLQLILPTIINYIINEDIIAKLAMNIIYYKKYENILLVAYCYLLYIRTISVLNTNNIQYYNSPRTRNKKMYAQNYSNASI